MEKLDRATWRIRNSIQRVLAGAPRGTVSDLIRTDLYWACRALFELLSGFSQGRTALVEGSQAALCASLLPNAGAAATTAVIRSPAERRFAQQRYGTPTLTFTDVRPRSGSYQLLVSLGGSLHDPAAIRDLLAPDGLLLVTLPPQTMLDAKGTALLDALHRTFANVRRFAQVRLVDVDLASPLPSRLSGDSFAFRELRDDDQYGPDAIAIVVLATDDEKWWDLQLHVGCGAVSLPGWINVDNQPYAGIDLRWDLSRGIPFAEAKYVYAEHFIEHLTFDQAKSFLAECRRMLPEKGVLRLSTPSLDWVWMTSYHLGQWPTDDDAVSDCFVINRGFRGWGHQFLFNFQTMKSLLHSVGFAEVRAYRYGESETPALSGIERHERYLDSPELPHVLIVEATGKGGGDVGKIEEYAAEYRRDVAVH